MNRSVSFRPFATFGAIHPAAMSVMGAVLPSQSSPLAAQTSLLMVKLPYAESSLDPTEQIYNNGFAAGANQGSLRGLLGGVTLGVVAVLAAKHYRLF